MRKAFISKYVLFVLFLATTATVCGQTKDYLTEDQARQEAQIAIEHIKNSHPNQYWMNDKIVWDRYEQKLLGRKGNIRIAKHYFDLAYLFSLASDTHTQIYPDKDSPGFETVYPVRFRTFSDGLYIVSANKDYEHYIGMKVVAFGEKPASEFMDVLSHYVSSDNVERRRTLAEILLVMPETYAVFGGYDNNRVKLVLEDIYGKQSIGFLEKTESKSFSTVFYEEPESFGILVPDHWKTAYDVFKTEVPVTRQNPRKKYWHKTMNTENGKLVEYIQINKNEDEEQGETQFDFLLRLFQEFRNKGDQIDRIVIDLRYNLGGWIKNTAALSGLLYGSDYYKHGKTVVLIGRETISAGTVLAADIEGKNYAYFVGEPTGSKPNMFLEHRPVDMPYSRFYAESSRELYIVTNENDKRKFLAPDFLVQERFEDFISGEDICLKKALEVAEEDVKSDFTGHYRSDLWRRPSQNSAFEKK